MATDHPYPPFSGDDATCPKCGGDADRRYMEAGTRHLSGMMIIVDNGPEWLLRTCEDCGHAWPEMCRDAEDPG